MGAYKQQENEVGGMDTTPPHQVHTEMKNLLRRYNGIKKKTLDDIFSFHHAFKCIHPFQNDNGRVGRLIMFKECPAHHIIPFIITDSLKAFYYRGLADRPHLPGYLRDTSLTAQDTYKLRLAKFRINS